MIGGLSTLAESLPELDAIPPSSLAFYASLEFLRLHPYVNLIQSSPTSKQVDSKAKGSKNAKTDPNGRVTSKASAKTKSKGDASTNLVASLASKTRNKKSVLVVASTNAEAENLAAEARSFINPEKILYLPDHERIPYEWTTSSLTKERIHILSEITDGEEYLVFTSIESFLRRLPEKNRIQSSRIRVKVGSATIEETRLLRQLVNMGYTREDRVETIATFSKKGSILDIYSPDHDDPIRIEFFGDEIETIRTFDASTQIAKQKIDEAHISAAGEVILDNSEVEKLFDTIEEKYGEDLERPSWLSADHANDAKHPGLLDLFPLVLETQSLLDYFPEYPLIILHPFTNLEEYKDRLKSDYETLFANHKTTNVCVSPQNLLDFDQLEMAQAKRLESASVSGSGVFIRPPESLGGRIRETRSRIQEIAKQGGKVILTSPYTAQMNRIAGIIRTEANLEVQIINAGQVVDLEKENCVWVLESSQRSGFSVPDSQLFVWSDNDIFGRSYKRRSRFKGQTSAPIESFLDLKEGDHVVHIIHGIGRFASLERVKAMGKERDFLVLEYADDDKLFVPLDQISMVQRYVGASDDPKLDNLGKASFKKVKERVEKRIEEFAQELIKTYAVRMSQRGYQFPSDTAWQEEFEAEFEYEETPDQMLAIESVKKDMETDRPMDRLICGDVGYGKTEVAIRAAFKAVMAGKQVAVICPTTILAMQHFQNFQTRYQHYPVSVDWVSRFRTRGEITEVKKKLKEGDLDVLVGTHALLSKDVSFKNLGLLIVDEEQRFGVAHKEALKNIKRLVDVLTLTATPIPRTLHMSLTGIRDLSIIQTPPKDRLPVLTYVMEDHDAIIKEAIVKEIERNGQVFYLHNRVQTLEMAAARIRGLIPSARIASLHGQMQEDEIEDVLLDFMDHKYDVLVTTSIIENGIDIPNANTLIVDRSDTFGLSQLYQIRGRVGRSNRQAYAFMLHHGSLTETGMKRLNTILEYQDLGSGFKVAMRDLEIRGAGNVLGREQSGDIADVGYELYIKLLDEAVRRLQGEKIDIEIRCAINLRTDFFLPDDYITDTRQRIEFYKRLESAGNENAVENIAIEMADRFGALPASAQTFVQIEKIRAMASQAGFEIVFQDDSGHIQFKAGAHFRVPPDHLVSLLKGTTGLAVQAGSKDTLFFKPKTDSTKLDEVIGILNKLVAPLVKK